VARGRGRRLRELGEDLDAPLVAAHDGLDLPGDAVEELAGEGSLGLGLERADLPHLVQVAHLHRRSRFHAGAARFETDWERRGGWRAFVQGRARRCRGFDCVGFTPLEFGGTSFEGERRESICRSFD
jgi:hypothetical protein